MTCVIRRVLGSPDSPIQLDLTGEYALLPQEEEEEVEEEGEEEASHEEERTEDNTPEHADTECWDSN